MEQEMTNEDCRCKRFRHSSFVIRPCTTHNMPKERTFKASSSSAPARSSSAQACEFDYSGAQACKALREEGYKVILVNSNPATIAADPGWPMSPTSSDHRPPSSNASSRKKKAGRVAADDGRPDRAQHGDGAVEEWRAQAPQR